MDAHGHQKKQDHGVRRGSEANVTNWAGGRALIDKTYRCEICGIESQNPVRWIVIQCNNEQLIVLKWTKEAADAPHARHYCGEAHAQIYISRWLESVCS